MNSLLNEKFKSSTAPIKVMLVDDRAEVRQSVEIFLSLQEDIEVVGEAGDGLQALEMARQLNPDVILMDIAMPLAGSQQFDGLDACREIKREGLNAAVIVLTVHGDRATRKRAQQAGCSGFIEKGVSPGELVVQIRELWAA